MTNWTTEQLLKLQKFYQEKYDEAEENIKESPYPTAEELQMEKSQEIIWLLEYMMDEKSWICKNFLK